MTTKYKVGDRVRIIKSDYSECGLEPDSIHSVSSLECGFVNLRGVYQSGTTGEYCFYDEELEPAPVEPATISFTLDIPNDLMKEFADHCERAADALARIQEIMSK